MGEQNAELVVTPSLLALGRLHTLDLLNEIWD